MDPKEDDDISIDFTRIKGFFKSEKKEEKRLEEHAKEPASDSKEEDLNIDFSKFKKFFKSDGKDEKEHKEKQFQAAEEKKSDDELSFDFGKLKKFFKSKEKETSSDQEISVNFDSIVRFLKKYGVVLIVLIPIILSIYVRMQAGLLPFADSWASASVMNEMRAQIASGVEKSYPNLPESNKNEIVNREFQKAVDQNRAQIDQRIFATSAYIKSFFQDEQGKNYMPDIDPYYWFRYAKNIVEHGHPGDTLKDGLPYDNHQLAPVGRYVFADKFHSYFLAYFYKFLHFFAPDLSLMRSLFYYPVFVSALCVLLVFLIARKIAGNFGGLLAGLMMSINFAFLGRTLFGHADSDAWVVFFPLLITWLFVTTIDSKSLIKIAIITTIAGFFTGVYPTAWSGWWYIFDFLLATIGLTFVYLVLINLKDIKRNIFSIFSNLYIRNIIAVGFVYFISTAIFVTLFSGWDTFSGSFLGPLSFPSIKAPTSASFWPNVLTTVAELNEGSMNQIINSVGGIYLFFISLVGIVLAVSRTEGAKKFDYVYILGSILLFAALYLPLKIIPQLYQSFKINTLLFLMIIPIFIGMGISIVKKDHTHDYRLSILLSLWFVSTIFASIKGIRFTLLLAPAFSVAFGVALGKIYNFLLKFMTKELKIHKLVGSSVLIILLLLIYVNPIKGAISSASSDIPIVNDAWYAAMAAIKQNSSENAIITSWWDFGHHFKVLADRPVTFDGTTQTRWPAHWVGKLTMINNELQAIGILRMLDCGGDNANSELIKINNDTHLSLKIINEIVLLKKGQAQKKLQDYGLSSKQSDVVLTYTHCNPPEAFYIASNDMIGKSGVWAHFGSWSFERADIWQNTRGMGQEDAVNYMIKKFNYTKEQADNYYSEIQDIINEPDANVRDSRANAWIAPWPGYGGTMNCNKEGNGTYLCQPISVGRDNSGRDVIARFQINLSNYDVIALMQQNTIRPSMAAFTTDDGLFFKNFNGTTIGYGMTIIPRNENELNVVLSSRELTGSMFTRMFFMQGHGLKYFKLFNHQRIFPGSSIETNIYTYKIDWEGKNATIVDDYVKKTINAEKLEQTSNEITANLMPDNMGNNKTNKTVNIS